MVKLWYLATFETSNNTKWLKGFINGLSVVFPIIDALIEIPFDYKYEVASV